jgi:hypothetical protein
MRSIDVRWSLIFSVAIQLGLWSATGRGQYQLPLSAVDRLPNAPSTYQLRDWRTVASGFDALAFDTSATGQFLPLVRIDPTPQNPALSVAFGLPPYVGETRKFGENGELIHESLASLGAVLSGTLVGIDKTAGPYNWVSMTREYYGGYRGQNLVLNTPFSVSGQSAWYDIFPNILFYSIADHYPNETYLPPLLNTIDGEFYDAVNKLTAGGANPNFNYTAYNFATEQPVNNGVWREPDMGLGMAWIEHAAYWRNKESDPAAAARYLNAVDWALSYYQRTTANPDYEILTPFGAYAAARMNAEHGRNYDIQKLVGWVFDRSAARNTKVMISGEQWGGQDVGGLMGFTYANTGSSVRGYAFSMNTFATALPMVPLTRYEDRYSRAIGKWMLNAASAAREFYADAHPPQDQSSEFWTGDPNHVVAYEGLRHHWRDAFDSEELFAGGDPLVYHWGPQTDFALYGSAFSGVFGSIVRPTNVDKVLQLDLLAADSYKAPAYDTYLYYNPHASAASVSIGLSPGRLYDLYDAASNRFLLRGASGLSFFNVPADDAVMLVVIPSGGRQTFDGRRMLIDGIVADYNAALLPGNLIRNADVGVASAGNTSRPGFWNGSLDAEWTTETANSPTHSLKLADQDAARSEEWRSFPATVADGSNRTLQLRWFWNYQTADEFHARLRLSADAAVGADLTNPLATYDFTVSGHSSGFEVFETSITVPAGVQSFDLTFITGGAAAMGMLYVDDISATLLPTSAHQMLDGDFNGDGLVDGRDLAIWKAGFQSNFDGADFLSWQRQMQVAASPNSGAIPEPNSALTLLFGWAAVGACPTIARSRRDRKHR